MIAFTPDRVSAIEFRSIAYVHIITKTSVSKSNARGAEVQIFTSLATFIRTEVLQNSDRTLTWLEGCLAVILAVDYEARMSRLPVGGRGWRPRRLWTRREPNQGGAGDPRLA